MHLHSVLKHWSSKVNVTATVPKSWYVLSFYSVSSKEHWAKDAMHSWFCNPASLPRCFWVLTMAQKRKFRDPAFPPPKLPLFSFSAQDKNATTRRGAKVHRWWPRIWLNVGNTCGHLGVLQRLKLSWRTLPEHQGSKPSGGWSWGSVWRKTLVWPSSGDQDWGPPGFGPGSRKTKTSLSNDFVKLSKW